MIANIRCLTKAAQHLNIPFTFLDENKNVVVLKTSNKRSLFFINSTVPLNNEVTSVLCKDKEFTYKTLYSSVAMPLTKGYFDPNRNEYEEYRHFKSINEITHDIEKNFKLPVVIKRNGGSQGKHVFLCNNIQEIKSAITSIFNQSNKDYDFVALAQEYIQPLKEFRVIILNNKIEFIYEKSIKNATFTGNLSPLHWDNAKAVLLDDQRMYSQIEEFIQPIFKTIDLKWSGIDIILSNENTHYLIELNSKPGFAYFIKDNNEARVISLYEKMLKGLVDE